MDPSKKRAVDGSQLSSTSHSAYRTSTDPNDRRNNGDGGDGLSFTENFLYPFIAESNRTYSESIIINTIVGLIVTVSTYLGCCYDVNREGVSPIVRKIESVVFFGYNGEVENRTTAALITMSLDIIILLLFLYTYIAFRVTFEFSKFSKFCMKYIFGCFSFALTYANTIYFFSSLSNLGVELTFATGSAFIISLILQFFMMLMTWFCFIPVVNSPYISESSAFLWRPLTLTITFYIFAFSVGIGHFFKFYRYDYNVLPAVIGLIGCYNSIKYGWSLQAKKFMMNDILVSSGIGFGVSCILSIVNVFYRLMDIIVYLVPLLVIIVFFIILWPILVKKRNNILNELSFEVVEELELATDDAKFEYFDSLNINTENKAFTYLVVGLQGASPLFLDFSLTKYLINKFPDSNFLLITQTWFVSFFPNEQLIMHTLISKINRMVKPTSTEKILRYQLHRIHIFRQSSASREANSDLSRVKGLTDSVIAENCRFWINAAMPHADIKLDFHRKLTAIRQKAEAGWAEVIDKYPNNARFASEYSRFLIEGVCEFKEGVKWYHKAIKIESGKRRETDHMFKVFVMSYPFYLKKKIVYPNGDINSKALMRHKDSDDGQNLGTVSEDSLHSSSKGLSSSSTGSLSIDDDSDSAIDLQESEKALPQAQLRLAFESAIRSIKSKVAKNTVVASIIKLIVIIIIAILLLIILSPIFSDAEETLVNLISINDIQRFYNAVGFQTFWFSIDNAKPLDIQRIKDLYGENLYKTSTFTNISEKNQGATLSNLTSNLNNYIDIMSSKIYLTGQKFQVVRMFTELLIDSNFEIDFCKESDSGGFFIEKKVDNSTMDKLLRTYIYDALKFSSSLSGERVFEGKAFCDMYVSYMTLNDMAEAFAKNESVVYDKEITHYLNYEPTEEEPKPQSIYMGHAKTNFPEEESEGEEEEEEEEEGEVDELSHYVDSITDAFIAFTPFLLLLASLPSVIFLTASLTDEIKEVKDILTSMSPAACKEASNKIQKGIIDGKKSNVVTSQAGTQFPFYIITLIDTAIVVVTVILCSLYAQNVRDKANALFSQMNLFIALRNMFMRSSFLTQMAVLSKQNDDGQIPFAGGVYKSVNLPFLKTKAVTDDLWDTLTKISMLQGIIDIGSETVPSALGYMNEIDDVRFKPRCVQEADTDNTFNFYRCLSFDRACALFIARTSEILTSLRFVKLESDLMYEYAMMADARIMPGFDDIIKVYKAVFEGTISQFKLAVIVFSIVIIVVALISFFIEISALKSISEMQKSFNTVTLRLNPIQFVQNQKAASLLVDGDDKDDSKIISAAHAVFFTSADAMILLNNEGIIEKLNPAATTIFHFTPEQMLGQHSTIIIPKDSQKNQQLYYTMQLMSSGQSGLVYETELDGVRDDGTKVPINATMIGFASDQRNAEVFAIMCKDQTEEVKQKEAVEIAKKQSDDLLLKILPPDIIRRINRGEKDIAIVVPSASIIFIDICQFSAYMATLSASQLMCNLNAVFTAYDKIVADLPLITKIKLIGDDYMAAAGLFSPDEPPKMHAIQMITFGLRVLDAIEDLNEQLNANLMVRIGVNSGGPIIAGVLGTDKPLFDIIGDTINVASRLQSTDIPGNVQISKGTYELVAAENRFNIEERGEIYLKGKGNQTTYLVTAKTAADMIPQELKTDGPEDEQNVL